MSKNLNIIIILIVGLFPSLFSQQFDKELFKSLPASVQESILARGDQTILNEEILDIAPPVPQREFPTPEIDNYGSIVPVVFGKELFQVQDNFPPQLKTAPSDYILGPGDILIFNFSGSLKLSKRVQIDREGKVFINEIGIINISGLSYASAQEEVNRIANASLIGTNIDITLAKLRPIQLYVVGNVKFPGSHILNPLSSINNVLFSAGGPTDAGSFRNISLKRNNKVIDTIDLYELFINGNSSLKQKIQSGDVLLINPVGAQVKIFGEVRRPAIFELKKDDGFKELLTFASGSTSIANKRRVTLTRTSLDQESFSEDLSFKELFKLKLKDGDQLFIHSESFGQVDPNKDNTPKVSLNGAFTNPGTYTFNKGETLVSLVERVGGYSENAYIDGGIFLRLEVKAREKRAFKRAAEKLEDSLIAALTSGQLSEISDPQLALTIMGQFLERLRSANPLGRIVTEFDINKMKKIPELDFVIQNGDRIIMPEQKTTVTVSGEILSPMTFTYIKSLDFKDYIDLAGGFTKNADHNETFLILPNGQSIKPKDGWLGSKNLIKPGTTIVVTRDTTKLSKITFWKSILPIFSNLVQTLAAIDALAD